MHISRRLESLVYLPERLVELFTVTLDGQPVVRWLELELQPEGGWVEYIPPQEVAPGCRVGVNRRYGDVALTFRSLDDAETVSAWIRRWQDAPR
jgi:hypothetical protein